MSQQEKKEKAKKEVTVTMGAAKLLGSGLVIMFLMVWVFVLGVLTGRGDINCLFQRLGLNKTDLAARLGVASDTPVSGVLPVSHPEESGKTMADSGKKSGQDDKGKRDESAEASPATKPADPAAG